MPDFIPRKDSDFLSWSGHFYDAASSFAAELNLPQALLDQLPPLRAAFVAAYHRAYSPAGSRVDTRAKNDARKALERPIRALAAGTLGATSTQRIEMGLKPRRVGKAAPLPRPATAPVLVIQSVAGRSLHLHLSTGTGRAKPHGVDCALVFWCAGENPAPTLGRRGLAKIASRRKCVIEIPSQIPPGTKVWVTAQWMNGRKLLGPLCAPVYDFVGGGLGRIGGLRKAA